MKAQIEWSPGEIFLLTAYDKGDEPTDAVDIPPLLIRDWQKAELDRQLAIQLILKHLRATNQEFKR